MISLPIYDMTVYISVSQSGRNCPLGAILRGKGAKKPKGAIGRQNNIKREKMLNQ